MTRRTVRIAIVSDIHVFNGASAKADGPSFIGTADPEDAPERHPFTGLRHLIEHEEIRADLLICPGDLADKADPSALNYAWKKLNDLKAQLNAEHLLATSGNHDVDSRNMHGDHDPKGSLQSLRPMFPAGEENLCDRYWSRNFAVFLRGEMRVVLLNSSAFHGYGRDADPEFKHGRVSSHTISALRRALEGSEWRINILVCHHHPAPYNPVGEEDYSEMLGGDQLLELLNSGDFGSWILIHGHKHYPRLAYASGGASSPVIFSAGSFSAVLYQKVQSRAGNQFYIIEIPIDDLDDLELDLAGTLTAWDWITMVGWQPAGPSSGLPHRSGFGWREGTRAIATAIAAKSTGGVQTGNELLAHLPKLRFLRPQDLVQVVRRLDTAHGIKVTLKDGMIIEVGRP